MNLGALDFTALLAKMKIKMRKITTEAIWYDVSDDEDEVDGRIPRRDSTLSNVSLVCSEHSIFAL